MEATKMKTIGIVQELHKKAIKNPNQWIRKNSYLGYFDKKRGTFELAHYGTVIMRYDVATWAIGKGAYSASDRDAINTILGEIGERSIRARIKNFCMGVEGVNSNRAFVGLV